MKKYLTASISVLAISGILINVLVSSFEDPFSLFRGLGLFRYYTLQSNLIVAIYFALFFNGKWRNNDLYKRFIGGVTIYITITFFIFMIFLQPGWHPTGWNAVSNVLSHYLVPVLTIFFFGKYHKEYEFKMNDMFWWIVYPILYVVFIVVFGSISGDYLYPFFQVAEVGVFGLIYTIILLVLFFLGLSFILMKIVTKK